MNATGLSRIDDQGFTLLGTRTGWDVDDIEGPPGEELDFGVNLVSTDSPISVPRLEVTYQPFPEPTVAWALVSGAGVLAWLRRRRRRPIGRAGARAPWPADAARATTPTA